LVNIKEDGDFLSVKQAYSESQDLLANSPDVLYREHLCKRPMGAEAIKLGSNDSSLL